MKKHMVWIVVALFMLTACSAAPEPTETTVPATGSNACVLLPTIEDINEYDKFIAASELIPDDFIKWEDIASLGEFQCFIILSRDEYLYGIGNGTSVWVGTSLNIDHTPDNDPFDEEYADIEMPNDLISMRTGKRSGTSGTIEICDVIRNGFKYRYGTNGSLLSITWYENGIEFCISGNLSSYPETGPQTGIGKLLSVSDAEFNTAVAEIKNNLETE